MSDNKLGSNIRWGEVPGGIALSCGCTRGIVKREAPAMDPETGHPKLNDQGEFVMETIEEIEESYCSEHSGVIIERQHAVQKALADGATPEEAQRILVGASPFPMLEDGGDDDGSDRR